jgi:hypothetical protein
MDTLSLLRVIFIPRRPIDEQLPEGGSVTPKHVAIKCNFKIKEEL